MAIFCLAPAFGVVPQRTRPYDGTVPNGYFQDSDDIWTLLLSSPPLGPKEGSCLRGVVFYEDALHSTQLNVEQVHGLVLDVDEFDGRPVYSAQDIAARLFHHRHIVHTTYSSTGAAPRYRVILPLAQPVPRSKFRALWELVNNDLGNVIGSRQWNADRLGYLPRLPTEAARQDYRWWIYPGPCLDPFIRYGELPDTPDRVATFGISNSVVDRTLWLPDEDAMGRARAYMRDAHAGVTPGARHHKLFEKACQLWWDFYLDLEGVTAILSEINSRFTVPKSQLEVLREVEAGFAWTRGEHARPQTVPPGSRRQRPEPVTLGKIEDVGRKLKRRPQQRELGDALVKLATSESFARTEEALALARSMARVLAEHFPHAEANQVATLFASSLSLMQMQAGPAWPTDLTVDTVQQVFASRQAELQTQRRHESEAQQEALATRISAAFRGTRSAPYTSDELQEYARLHRCTVQDLRRRFVISYGKSHYFFLGGTYTAPEEHYPEIVGKDALAALEPFGIECYRVNREGSIKLKSGSDLVHEYGTVAENMVADLTRNFSTYDADTGTFHYATCPMRPVVKPERVPEVEEYLRIIGSESFLDWLSFVPNMGRPLKAMYLWGKPGTGKSLIGECIARLWTTFGPTTGEDLLGNFNESVSRCPFIKMDEQLPVDFRGRRGTERFRKEIAEVNRPLTGKFKKNASMHGCLRYMIMANRPDLIETDDTLTESDIEGIKQRLEVAHIPPEAGAYLRALGRDRTERWITDDLFAKHMLYLRDHRETGVVGRFGPESPPSAATTEVHTSLKYSGFSDLVMRWMYLCVTGDIPAPQGALLWSRMPDGKFILLVNADEVSASWELIMGRGTIPSAKKITLALRTMRIGRTRTIVKGSRRRFHVISLDAVGQWMDHCDADKDRFLDRAAATIQTKLHELTEEVENED